MAKREVVKKPEDQGQPSNYPRAVVQEALQVVWQLKGKLKCLQIAYLKIGELLEVARNKRQWEALKHTSLEDYARKRLKLGRAALYRYLQVLEDISRQGASLAQARIRPEEHAV